MECGSWCVYYTSRGVSGACTNCSAYANERKPKYEFRNVNLFELAEKLKGKQQEQKNNETESEILGICPNCGEKSFFNNKVEKKSECLNLKCKTGKTDIFDRIVWPDDYSKTSPDKSSTDYKEGLSNPLLLGVKMFLAEIRSWRRQYRDGEYVCSDFAKEVYDASTERGIRCGYVVIGFKRSLVGHAVVAFETDYGLVFIEPQDGETIDISVGKSYSTVVEGVPERDEVRLINIYWNDGTSTKIGE